MMEEDLLRKPGRKFMPYSHQKKKKKKKNPFKTKLNQTSPNQLTNEMNQ